MEILAKTAFKKIGSEILIQVDDMDFIAPTKQERYLEETDYYFQ